MEISIEHFDGKYPQFNINLHSSLGAEPFLSIKGCRIVEGKNGPFVSYPATKNEKTGKYWNHVYGGEKFNEAVLAKATQSQAKRPSHDAAKARDTRGSGFDDMDSDIPF